MKIVSEEQLNYIKTEFKDLIDQRAKEYVFEGTDKYMFNNLLLFSDNLIYDTLRKNHYLSMTDCQRIWNEYFWYLRYYSDILKINDKAKHHEQAIFKVLEKLYNNNSPCKTLLQM